MGRQPWVVQGLLKTSRRGLAERLRHGRSDITLAGFALLYGVLAAVDGWLMFRYAKSVPRRMPRGRRRTHARGRPRPLDGLLS